MKLFKSVLLILPILWQTNQAFSKLGVKLHRFEEMTEQVGTLLSNCSRLRLNNIAVVSDSEATVKWTPKSLERISLLNLKIVNPRKQFFWNITWHEKFHTFIIITAKDDDLEYLIKGLRETTLWNPAALYVLFDNLTLETGCDNAENFLFTTWNLELLSSTFFCVDPVQGFMMYTFNPFTEWAPSTWEIHGRRNSHFNHPIWTWFKQKLIPGLTTCKNITFVKTRTLNKYPVGAVQIYRAGKSPNALYADDYDKADSAVYMEIIFEWDALVLETQVKLMPHDFSYIKTITSGKKDVLINTQFISKSSGMIMTYAIRNFELGIMTRAPGYQDGFEKILKYMNPMFITGILLMCLATAIVLGKCTGQRITSGCLEVLRIILGGSMIRFPETKPLRIHMLTIFLLSIISTSTFQGNLSSLLTRPILKPSIDNLEDLKASGYPIYMFHGDVPAMSDEIDHSRIRAIDSWDCSEYVEKLENVACVSDKRLLRHMFYTKNLYISKDSITNFYATYIVRPNWPLTEEFTRKLITVHQTGMLNFYVELTKIPTKYDKKWKRIEIATTSGDFQILKLQNLMFVFYILIFGHVVSIFVFVGEMFIWRQRMKKMRSTLPLDR